MHKVVPRVLCDISNGSSRRVDFSPEVILSLKMGKVSEWYRVAYQMEGLNEQSLLRGCSGVIKCKMEKLQKGIV